MPRIPAQCPATQLSFGLRVGLLALAMLVLAAAPPALAGTADATEPVPAAALPPAGRGAEQRPSEWGLVTLEILGASATGLLSIVGAVQIGDPLEFDRGGRDLLAAAALVGVPALQGAAACVIGRLSKHYQGRCRWPVLGAYLGVAPFVPLAFLAGATAEDALGAGIGAAAALAVGFLIGAPVGATWAWNATKDRRPTTGVVMSPLPSPRQGAEPPPRRGNQTGEISRGTLIPVALLRF